jgi:uncharacterized protein (DUF1330 family)
MSAFVIVDTRIENPEAYEEYKKLAKPIAEKYGGRYRARGGAMDVRETVSRYGRGQGIRRLRGVCAGQAAAA